MGEKTPGSLLFFNPKDYYTDVHKEKFLLKPIKLPLRISAHTVEYQGNVVTTYYIISDHLGRRSTWKYYYDIREVKRDKEILEAKWEGLNEVLKTK